MGRRALSGSRGGWGREEGEPQLGEASRAGGPEPETPQPAGGFCLDVPICTMGLHLFFSNNYLHVHLIPKATSSHL